MLYVFPKAQFLVSLKLLFILNKNIPRKSKYALKYWSVFKKLKILGKKNKIFSYLY